MLAHEHSKILCVMHLSVYEMMFLLYGINVIYSTISIANIGTYIGIMAGWHYGEGGDLGLWIYDS